MVLIPDPVKMNFMASIFLIGVYGYILMKATQSISSGSEMLIIKFWPRIEGGLLIPILGVVSDCDIIILSGLGPGNVSEIQHQISVGVRSLVESTAMLLTIPWRVGL
jgi:hypothetical protein